MTWDISVLVVSVGVVAFTAVGVSMCILLVLLLNLRSKFRDLQQVAREHQEALDQHNQLHAFWIGYPSLIVREMVQESCLKGQITDAALRDLLRGTNMRPGSGETPTSSAD